MLYLVLLVLTMLCRERKVVDVVVNITADAITADAITADAIAANAITADAIAADAAAVVIPRF